MRIPVKTISHLKPWYIVSVFVMHGQLDSWYMCKLFRTYHMYLIFTSQNDCMIFIGLLYGEWRQNFRFLTITKIWNDRLKGHFLSLWLKHFFRIRRHIQVLFCWEKYYRVNFSKNTLKKKWCHEVIDVFDILGLAAWLQANINVRDVAWDVKWVFIMYSDILWQCLLFSH